MSSDQKRIQTKYFYGHEPRILWIYKQPISDEFPQLFAGFWSVYETWYKHEERLIDGTTTFLFDAALPLEEQNWQRERFGNYLYGSLVSFYFSWESLQAVEPLQSADKIRQDLVLLRQISGVVRELFTALDALSCCIYIAEGKIPPGLSQKDADAKHLRMLAIKSLKQKLGALGAYSHLAVLLGRPEFVYLSAYRNLLTHRPFPQFQIDGGLYYLPTDLTKLDSVTQPQRLYMKADVRTYLSGAYTAIAGDVERLLPELNTRYRRRI